MQKTGKAPFRQPTASGFYIRSFYQVAVRNGLDADRMLEQVGLSPTDIHENNKRTEVEKLADFIISLCDVLQDESMSLSAHPVPRGSFYMMGKLTVHEPTLHKAILQIQRFFSLVSRAFNVDLRIQGRKAILTFDLLDPELDDRHLFAEMNLLMLHRYCSWLVAENIPMSDVYFSYKPPQQVKEYAWLFPGRHVFKAASMGFTFHKRFLEREIVQNIGTMKSFMRRCPMVLFAHPDSDFSLSNEIHSLLFKQLKNRTPTLDEVADYLLLTRRTLIRRLNEEGSSFQAIKDQVRRDRAIYYLTSQNVPLSEIAGKVGYSDPSVFTRAFRTWTGVTPRQYRRHFLNT